MNDNNKIENNELRKILSFVKEDSVFFDSGCRLLSDEEIKNYKIELQTDLNIIPLIDFYDNNYLIFNIDENKFQMFDISTNMIWKDVTSISSYINEIEKN